MYTMLYVYVYKFLPVADKSFTLKCKGVNILYSKNVEEELCFVMKNIYIFLK